VPAGGRPQPEPVPTFVWEASRRQVLLLLGALAFEGCLDLPRRVMYGDMHVRAFDWAEPAPGGDPWAPRRAALVADRVVPVRAQALAVA